MRMGLGDTPIKLDYVNVRVGALSGAFTRGAIAQTDRDFNDLSPVARPYLTVGALSFAERCPLDRVVAKFGIAWRWLASGVSATRYYQSETGCL